MKIIIISFVIILFSESVHSLRAQSPSDKFKSKAISNMNEGLYGEAIDLLNKYISENPQNAEGYYLRGICLEARGQYEFSVYDLRSASKLKRSDSKIAQALARVTEVWYTQLYNKIEGHKREIAINSKKPINYLEIGKCYKNLGNWSEAEEWYDKYLTLEEPSADEVIRYTEILAKNGHISKGELILKKFVEKYPEDHRLWSRYGYFTLWLGKNKISIAAFTEALRFRPYFKEAIDGLHLAQGKGAVYSVNDTSYRYNKFTGTFQKRSGREYPIDRYFRLLKKNSSNDSLRLLLIAELVRVNRLVEARQQLELLNKDKVDKSLYSFLSKDISEKLNQTLLDKIEQTKQHVALNPNDRKAVLELANYYAWNNDVQSFEKTLVDYLIIYPNDDEIRFELAKKLSWFKEFEKSKAHIDILLSRVPKKTDYQLLRGQIAVWTNTDSALANSLLNDVLSKEPNNLQALMALAIVNYQNQKFAAAENYIAKIEKLALSNGDVQDLKYNLAIQKKQFEEAELDKLLESARNSLSEKKCQEAITRYKEYFSKVEPKDAVRLELANAYICGNDYSSAIKIYTSLIEKNYDYDLIKERAKLYFWANDSLSAMREFKNLYAINNNDAEVKLFLADSYFKLEDYNNAKKLYTELLNESPASLTFKTRLSWLQGEVESDGSLSSLISNFPSYTLLTPEVFHFSDNLKFKYNLQGLRGEVGLTKFLAIGGSIYRGDVASDSIKLNFSKAAGNLTIFPTKLLTAAMSFGQTKYLNNRKQDIAEFSLKSEIKDRYSITGSYGLSDAVQILYSPFLVDTGLTVTDYSIEGEYFTPTQMVLSGLYSHKKISDGNKSYLLTLRLGRKFAQDFTAGYEYYNLNTEFESTLYYSPGRFESHSLWVDYNLIHDDIFDFTVGGKLGLIPNSDFLLKEFKSSLTLKLFESFTLQGQLVFGENSREQVNYRSTAISVIAFWVF